MFHQELPFPAPLSAEHYLSPLTLKWLILSLCFTWPEHRALSPSTGPGSTASLAQLLEASSSSWQLRLTGRIQPGRGKVSLTSCGSEEPANCFSLSTLTLPSWVHMDSAAHGREHPMAALLGR